MYRIYHNGKLIYTPRSPNVTIGQAELTQEANCAGAIKMTIYPQNPEFSKLVEMTSIITAKEDEETIYEGRITQINSELSFEKNFQTEGALAYLNDSVMRPFIFSGDVQEFVEKILQSHNEQVEENKKIFVGNIGHANKAIRVTEEDYTTAMQQLQTQLPGSLGGYLEIRYKNGKKYLDYLEKQTQINTQTIEYGKNLIDLSDQKTGTDIGTVIIPLGAKGEDKNRITIAEVNDGKDYLENKDAIKTYGRIVKKVIYDDITNSELLMKTAQNDLASYALPERTIELTAADLAAAGYTVRSFTWGQRIKCKSRAHGIDTIADMVSKKIDLCNPANSRIVAGDAKATYTSSKKEIEKKIEDSQKELASSIDQAKQELNEDLVNAAGLYQTTIVQDDGSKIFYLHDKKTLAQSKLVLKMNAKALGVSLDGGNTYSWGFDLDGKAILNEIYTIGLDADQLKTGKIIANDKTGKEIFYLNVETGEVRIGADCVSIKSEKLEEYINEIKTTADNASTEAKDATQATNDAIALVEVEYYKSTSPTELAGGKWQPATPTWAEGSYIWSRTKTTTKGGTVAYSTPVCITGSTGTPGKKGDKGDQGNDGKGIKTIVPQYYLSTSSTKQEGGSWNTTQPTWAEGKYIWTRSYITWDDGTTSDTTPVLASALNGLGQELASVKKTVTKQGSSLEVIENQIQEKVWKEDITTEIKNLKVGGRNLAQKQSQGWQSFQPPKGTNQCHSFLSGIPAKIDESIPKGTKVTCTIEIKWEKCAAESGKTMSAWMQGSQDGGWSNVNPFTKNLYTYDRTASGQKIYTVTNEWDGLAHKYDIQLRCDNSDGNGIFYWRCLKAEIGDKATDWTPAPEDIDGAVDQAQSTADQAQSTVTAVTAQVESLKTATEALSKAMQSYVKEDELETYKKQVESQLSQTPDAIEARFKTIEQNVSKVGSSSDDKWAQLETYIRFTQNGVALGRSDSPITLEIRNDRICFVQSGQVVAYYTNNQLYNSNLVVTTTANILGLIFTKSGRHLQIS